MTYDGLEREFKGLQGEWEGYIQMSDEPLKILENAILPSWQSLHKGANFIFEAGLFCKKSEQCVMIKQFNNEFLFASVNLRDFKESEKGFENFIALNGKKARICQIWQVQRDENCLNLPVLKPKFTLFAGFAENSKTASLENSALKGDENE